MVNETCPRSIRRFFTNFSVTMSRLRSGSRTARSASRTAASVTAVLMMFFDSSRDRRVRPAGGSCGTGSDSPFGHVADDGQLEAVSLVRLEHEDQPQRGGPVKNEDREDPSEDR